MITEGLFYPALWLIDPMSPQFVIITQWKILKEKLWLAQKRIQIIVNIRGIRTQVNKHFAFLWIEFEGVILGEKKRDLKFNFYLIYLVYSSLKNYLKLCGFCS